MKRTVLILVLVACVCAFLSAGGRSAQDSSGPMEITWYKWAPNSPALSYWKDALWVQELERRMNVKLTFRGPMGFDISGGGVAYPEASTIQLASGDVDDLFLYNWNLLYQGGIEGGVNDGLIFHYGRHQKYLDMVPNWLRIVNADPDMLRDVSLNDGTIPLFAMINERPEVVGYSGLLIRKDWLDRLGLQVPTTTQELYNVLKAFKDRDANGNGDPNDEIPMGGTGFGLLSQLMTAWTLRYNMFYPDMMNPGKMTYWTMYNGGRNFTQFLTDMAQWYREGLLDRDVFSQTNTQNIAKVTNDRLGVTAGSPQFLSNWTSALRATKPELGNRTLFVGLPRIKGIDGIPYTHHNPFVRLAQVAESTTISPAAERAGKTPTILKVMYYLYSEEGQVLHAWGVEGVSFYVDAQGNRQFTDLVSKDPQFPIAQKVLQYANPFWGSWPKVMRYDAWLHIETADDDAMASHRVFVEGDRSILVRNVRMNQRQMEEFTPIMADINTRVEEFVSRVITGQRPLSDIPGFLRELDNMGLQRAYQIFNEANEIYMRQR